MIILDFAINKPAFHNFVLIVEKSDCKQQRDNNEVGHGLTEEIKQTVTSQKRIALIKWEWMRRSSVKRLINIMKHIKFFSVEICSGNNLA